MTAQDTAGLVARITGYLATGGAFNPELANHPAVRDLLADCRDALEAMRRELAERDRWVTHWQTKCQATAGLLSESQAEGRRKDEALRKIAGQATTRELYAALGEDAGDFESAYDECVTSARIALAARDEGDGHG